MSPTSKSIGKKIIIFALKIGEEVRNNPKQFLALE